ncbi:uncharacterized protein LOC144095246 [Amblyomma americanum]
MYSPIALSLLVVCTSTIVLAKLGSPGGPQKLHRDVADSFKVISSYPYSVAISDSDNDGTLECLAANRTAIDEEAQTATMTWILPETEFSPKYESSFKCILWTRREVKDSVPQVCIDHFVDTCGVAVPEHSRDLCIDGEGDY